MPRGHSASPSSLLTALASVGSSRRASPLDGFDIACLHLVWLYILRMCSVRKGGGGGGGRGGAWVGGGGAGGGGALAATYSFPDERRFEGEFVDDFATRGTYTDEGGARFTVEMRDKIHVKELGDAAFKSKARQSRSLSDGCVQNWRCKRDRGTAGPVGPVLPY